MKRILVLLAFAASLCAAQSLNLTVSPASVQPGGQP